MLRDENNQIVGTSRVAATQIRKNDEEIIYDLTDLMRILKVSRRTLFTWISEGILPSENAW